MSDVAMVSQASSQTVQRNGGAAAEAERTGRRALRGMSYAEGEKALAPAHEAPVQMLPADGGDAMTGPKDREEQLAPAPAPEGSADVHAAAASGVKGSGGSLPFASQIQKAFGRHDVSSLRAHTGGAAQSAARSIGASAYASGSDVAFGGAPDLHTAAHEAAHVVQQRAGIDVAGGVGKAGDRYEQNADAVADRVVRGTSAEDLLGPVEGGGASAVQSKAVQLKTSYAGRHTNMDVPTDRAAFAGMIGASQRDAIKGWQDHLGSAFEFIDGLDEKADEASGEQKEGLRQLNAQGKDLVMTAHSLIGKMEKIVPEDWADRCASANEGLAIAGQVLDVFDVLMAIGSDSSLVEFKANPCAATAEAWADHITDIFSSAANVVSALPLPAELKFIGDYFTGMFNAPAAVVAAFKTMQAKYYGRVDEAAGIDPNSNAQIDGTTWRGDACRLRNHANGAEGDLGGWLDDHRYIRGVDIHTCPFEISKATAIFELGRQQSQAQFLGHDVTMLGQWMAHLQART